MKYTIISINNDREENKNKIRQTFGKDELLIKAFNGNNPDDIELFKKTYPDFDLSRYLENPSFYVRNNRRNGEIGCWMSHFHVWNYMVNNAIPNMMVFEDDCYVDQNTKHLAASILVPNSDKFMMLGDWAEVYYLTNNRANLLIENCYEYGFLRMPFDEYLFAVLRSVPNFGARVKITRQLYEVFGSDIEDSGDAKLF
jgi:GR25 family glycosyltransferase involved in LPS biosynthesis